MSDNEKHKEQIDKIHKYNQVIFYIAIFSWLLANFGVYDNLVKFESESENPVKNVKITFDSDSVFLQVVRWLQLILTVALEILLVKFYILFHEFCLSVNLTRKPLVSSWFGISLLLEMSLNAVFNFPFVTMTYKMNHADHDWEAEAPIEVLLLYLMLLFRSYHPFRILIFKRNSTAMYEGIDGLPTVLQRIQFSFKIAVDKWGLNVASLVMIIYNNVFAFGLQKTEALFMPFYEYPPIDWRTPLSGIFGAFQCLIPLSLGDFVPKTFVGRITVILCTLLGYFMISIFMFSLFKLLAFSQADKKAISFCNYLDSKETLIDKASKVINAFVRKEWLHGEGLKLAQEVEHFAEFVGEMEKINQEDKTEFEAKRLKRTLEEKVKVYKRKKYQLKNLKEKLEVVVKQEFEIKQNNEEILRLMAKLNKLVNT